MMRIRSSHAIMLAALVAAGAIIASCGGGGGGGGAVFSISSVSPPGGNDAGTNEVTVSGNLFEDAVAEVYFGTYDEPTFPAGMTQATAYPSTRNTTTIVCTVPAGTGTVDVVVYNPTDDVEAIKAGGYTYVTEPDVTAISPAVGSTAGGRIITITCSGTPPFVNTPATPRVIFDYGGTDPVEATGVTVDSTTQISCILPAHAAAAGVTVWVRNGDYGTDTIGGFDYVQGMIGSGDGADTTHADDSGSTTIYIDGSDWPKPSEDIDALSTVTIDGAPAAATPDDTTDIVVVTVPPLPEGFHDVTVTTNGGVNPVTLTDALYVTNPSTTIYVSDAGDDATGDGSAANPYRSISEAIASGSPETGWTILCLCELTPPAVFSAANGETWPLPMPSGVRLQGLGQGVTDIVGDSSQSTSMIFAQELGAGSVIDRFTMRSANSNAGTSPGGAVFVNGGELAVSNCRFWNNQVDGDGGAIAVAKVAVTLDARLTVSDCSFEYNWADLSGGAIVVGPESALYVTGSTFSWNEADKDLNTTGNGGAIAVGDVDSVVAATDCTFDRNLSYCGGAISIFPVGPRVSLTGCTIYDNHADLAGGGIYSFGDDMLMQNCLVEYNYAATDVGGGVVLADSGDDTVHLLNNTFVRNETDYGFSRIRGDAVFMTNMADAAANECFPRLTNNIFAYNRDDLLFGWQVSEYPIESTNHRCDPYVDYSCFHAGGVSSNDYADGFVGLSVEPEDDYLPTNGGPGTAFSQPYVNTGNISEDRLEISDPDFVNDTGPTYNWHLIGGSPCSNAGDPARYDPDGSRSDMGCYGGYGAELLDNGGTVGRVLLLDGADSQTLDTVRVHTAGPTLGNNGTASADPGAIVADAAQFDSYAVVLVADQIRSHMVSLDSGAIVSTPLGTDATPTATAAELAVDGNRVFVSDNAQVLYYTISDVDGDLTYVGNQAVTGQQDDMLVLNGYAVSFNRATGEMHSYSADETAIALVDTLDLGTDTYHDAEVVAGRYIVVRLDDATNEKLQVVSVSPTDGTVAVVGAALNTGDGTNLADAMVVNSNKVVIANSNGNHVRVFAVNLSGAISEATGSPFSTEGSVSGGTGTKSLASGDAFVYCYNATDGDISVFTMDVSTGALSAGFTTVPFTPADAETGRGGLLYLGGNLLLATDDAVGANEDLHLYTTTGAGVISEILDGTDGWPCNTVDPKPLLHMR